MHKNGKQRYTCQDRGTFTVPAADSVIKRTAVYCRVSSRMDEQLRSIGRQAKYLIDMVVRHPGWIYQGVYIDICTGSRVDKRTELQRMLTECRQGLIDKQTWQEHARYAEYHPGIEGSGYRSPLCG